MVRLEKNLILTPNSYSHINQKVAIKKNQIKELDFAIKQQAVWFGSLHNRPQYGPDTGEFSSSHIAIDFTR